MQISFCCLHQSCKVEIVPRVNAPPPDQIKLVFQNWLSTFSIQVLDWNWLLLLSMVNIHINVFYHCFFIDIYYHTFTSQTYTFNNSNTIVILSDMIFLDKCTKFKIYIMTTGTQKQRGMFYVCFYILRYIDIYQGTNRDKNATWKIRQLMSKRYNLLDVMLKSC